jgi:pimeloyl-ACP methyl ester carboxylesterase
VVVFESGAGQEIDTWSGVLPAVAEVAPVLAYERPGMGLSEWDGATPTPEHSIALLRTLLETVDVPPPYILVGHSWGGVLIRYFAARHPGDVVGLVYVDPTDLVESPDDHPRVLEQIGAPASALEAFEVEVAPETMARIPAPIRAERSAIRGLLDRDLASRAIPTPPPVPTAMLIAGGEEGDPPPELEKLVDMRAFDAAWQTLRIRRMRDWLPERPAGRFVVAEGAGHFVHHHEPSLVVDAIRRIVASQPARR